MTELSPELGSYLPLRVMLVDLDPIFRLGLKTCLERQPESFEVVADFGRSTEILSRLEALIQADKPSSSKPKGPVGRPIDLLIWAVDIRHGGQPMALGMPQVLRSRFPELPICVLLGQNDSWLIEELWQGGIAGCWLKDAGQEALLEALRQIALGQRVWDARLLSQLTQQDASRLRSRSRASGGWIDRMRQSLGDRSLRELEVELTELDAVLAGAGLGVWERLVLEGRFREMQMARRFVRVLIMPDAADQNTVPPQWPTQREREQNMATAEAKGMASLVNQGDQEDLIALDLGEASPSKGEFSALEAIAPKVPAHPILVSENQFHSYKGALIEAVIAKFSQSLQNLTSEPLEVDILSPTKRQELFFIILRLVEETLDDLRFSQVTLEQLTAQRSQILKELWQRATADFWGKYVMLAPPSVSSSQEIQVVPTLFAQYDSVNAELLSKIPWVEAWMAHLLFQIPLEVENQAAVMGSPAAMRQAEALLENLMIRVANAVVAPVLNQFGTAELVKQQFYDRRWISTREIERFRNALSWKYRMAQWFGEPKNIFESQRPVLVLTEVGIRQQEFYQPRDLELQQLRGFPLMVTLALEARDAIAPPLRASFTWLGRGVVYVLTQVVGRGIGLIGRGIIQGVGTAWQETRETRSAASKDRKS